MTDLNLDFSDYHRTVIGYHGTTAAAAERLVAGEPFAPSRRDHDWLGGGIYFWEYAPKQAWRWAGHVAKKRGEAAAVIGAVIRLGNCLDLLDPGNTAAVVKFKKTTVESFFAAAGTPVPTNVKSRKRLDCAVFDLLYAESDDSAAPIETARAVYVPTAATERVWKGSWIYAESHIQVCVREARNVLAVWHVRRDGRYGKD